MTRPNPAAKVLLVQDRRTASESRRDTPIRRYRLARMRFDSRLPDSESRFDSRLPDSESRFDSRLPDSESRFDYLKRVYD